MPPTSAARSLSCRLRENARNTPAGTTASSAARYGPHPTSNPRASLTRRRSCAW